MSLNDSVQALIEKLPGTVVSRDENDVPLIDISLTNIYDEGVFDETFNLFTGVMEPFVLVIPPQETSDLETRLYAYILNHSPNATVRYAKFIHMDVPEHTKEDERKTNITIKQVLGEKLTLSERIYSFFNMRKRKQQ